MSDFTLFSDRLKQFECDVSVEGAKLANTTARLILNYNEGPSTLYEGTISANGTLTVDIPPIKNTESDAGTAVLEIVADSTVFSPWTSPFIVKRAKNVVVEMKDSKKKPIKPQIKVVAKVKPTINEEDKWIKNTIHKYITNMSKETRKRKVAQLSESRVTKSGNKWAKKVYDNYPSAYTTLAAKLYPTVKVKYKK